MIAEYQQEVMAANPLYSNPGGPRPAWMEAFLTDADRAVFDEAVAAAERHEAAQAAEAEQRQEDERRREEARIAHEIQQRELAERIDRERAERNERAAAEAQARKEAEEKRKADIAARQVRCATRALLTLQRNARNMRHRSGRFGSRSAWLQCVRGRRRRS